MLKLHLALVTGITALAALAGPAAASRLATTNNFGTDYNEGKVAASVDLDEKAVWDVSVSADRSVSTDPNNASWNDTFELGSDYTPSETLTFNADMDFSVNNNLVTSTGPTLGTTYTWLSVRGKDSREILSLDFNCQELFYAAETVAIRRSFMGDKTTRRDIYLDQTYPNLSLDLPIISDFLTLSASGGDYFYNQDPTEMAALINRFPHSAAASTMNSMSSGLLYDAWEAGLDIDLPWKLTFQADYGMQHQVSPDQLATTYDASLTAKLSKHWKVKVGWSRNLPTDFPDQYTLKVTYKF